MTLSNLLMILSEDEAASVTTGDKTSAMMVCLAIDSHLKMLSKLTQDEQLELSDMKMRLM